MAPVPNGVIYSWVSACVGGGQGQQPGLDERTRIRLSSSSSVVCRLSSSVVVCRLSSFVVVCRRLSSVVGRRLSSAVVCRLSSVVARRRRSSYVVARRRPSSVVVGRRRSSVVVGRRRSSSVDVGRRWSSSVVVVVVAVVGRRSLTIDISNQNTPSKFRHDNRFLIFPKAENLHFNELLTL